MAHSFDTGVAQDVKSPDLFIGSLSNSLCRRVLFVCLCFKVPGNDPACELDVVFPRELCFYEK